MNSNPTGPTQRVLDRLKKVKRSGKGWTALCPSHADKENSLSINVGDDDCALLKCHAGCGVEAIVAALDLKMKDLFTKKGGEGSFIPSDNTSTRQRLGCSLAQYAEAKRIPADFLTSVGLRDFNYLKHPAVRIPYFGTDDEAAAVRFRIALTGKKFRWRKGDTLQLYGLWRLKKAKDEITLVEGESDSHTLWHHGIESLGLPGAGNWKEDRDADHLERFKIIYVVVEPDDGGADVTKWL